MIELGVGFACVLHHVLPLPGGIPGLQHTGAQDMAPSQPQPLQPLARSVLLLLARGCAL